MKALLPVSLSLLLLAGAGIASAVPLSDLLSGAETLQVDDKRFTDWTFAIRSTTGANPNPANINVFRISAFAGGLPEQQIALFR